MLSLWAGAPRRLLQRLGLWREDAGVPPAVALRAAAEAFGQALIRVGQGRPTLLAGDSALEVCGQALGLTRGDAAQVLGALAERAPAAGQALDALSRRGAAFDLVLDLGGGRLGVSGAVAGALCLVTLTPDRAGRSSRAVPDRDSASGLASALLDSHPFAALLMDEAGRMVFANRAAQDEALPDPMTMALGRDAVAAGAPREALRWRGGGAERTALRWRATPREGGGVAVWAWDATLAEGAAEALARRSAGLIQILAEAADAVAIFGADQRLTYANPAFARLWGLEPAWLAEGPSHGALLDRLRQDRRLPETVDFARFKAEELARHERLTPSPEAIWRVAGDRILRVLSLPEPDGGLSRLFSDITPEVRLKSQWNQLIQVRQATLDKLTDAVAVFGADGRLKLSNDAFQALWRIPPAALTGEALFDGVVERCLPILHDLRFWTELKGRITDPDPGVRAAARGEALTTAGRRLAWQSRPLPDGATLVSFADVTDARRVEEALRDREAALAATERLKRDFVSSVSYELRTPLTTILGYAELLEGEAAALPERARGWVAAVRAAAGDLARTVEDILAFAEIDAGEMALDLKAWDAAHILDGAVARWGPQARAAGVTLSSRPGAGGTIRADGLRLGRALDHLIEQALRQTPAGGQVTLATRRAFGEVCLEVADNGRGIPFHVQAHIFERFSGDEGAGTGMGLALVKALVELHGGWVAVESAPGAGAVFTCHLPEATAEAVLG